MEGTCHDVVIDEALGTQVVGRNSRGNGHRRIDGEALEIPAGREEVTTQETALPVAEKERNEMHPTLLRLGGLFALLVVILVCVALIVQGGSDDESNNDSSPFVLENSTGGDAGNDGDKATLEPLLQNGTGDDITSSVIDGAGTQGGSTPLPLVSQNISEGYDNSVDFGQALSSAATWIATSASSQQEQERTDGFGGSSSFSPLREPVQPTESGGGGVLSHSPRDEPGSPDYICLDNKFSYAASADKILVWDQTNGTIVFQILLPSSKEYLEQEIAKTNLSIDEDVELPLQNIQVTGLLCTQPGGFLVAFVNGYGTSFAELKILQSGGNASTVQSLFLQGYLSTQIRVYKTNTNDGHLDLVQTKNIHGKYQDARSIDDNIYVTTVSEIDAFRYLQKPLIDNPNMTAIEKNTTMQRSIDSFVHDLQEEMSVRGLFPDNVLQLQLWQHSVPLQESDLVTRTNLRALNNLVYLSSFNPAQPQHRKGEAGGKDDDDDDDDDWKVFSNAFFAPSTFVGMYNSTQHGMIILTALGHDYMQQTTYVICMAINEDNTTSLASMGSVIGYPPFSHSVRVVDQEIRFLTRNEERIYTVPTEEVVEPSEAELHNDEEGELLDTPPDVIDVPFDNDESMEFPPNNETRSLIASSGLGHRQLRRRLMAPSTTELKSSMLIGGDSSFITPTEEFEDPFWEALQGSDVSSGGSSNSFETLSEVYASVLDLSVGGKARSTKLDNTTFVYDAAFFRNNTLCIFTDNGGAEFFVINMTTDSVSDPTLIGKIVNLTGFSLDSLPMGDDDKLLSMTETAPADGGFATSMSVTIFDGKNPVNPVALTSYTIRYESLQHKGVQKTALSWSFGLAEYLDGKLIIPVQTVTNFDDAQFESFTGYNDTDETFAPSTESSVFDSNPFGNEGANSFSFDLSEEWQDLSQQSDHTEFLGFFVFDVSEDSIQYQFNISHVPLCSQCDVFFVERLFIQDSGNVMTLRETSVVSTGVFPPALPEERVWELSNTGVCEDGVDVECWKHVLSRDTLR